MIMKFLAAALFMAGFASAQSEAAPVIIGTYYEDNVGGTSGCTTTCSLLLAPAPAGKAVFNKSLDCLVQLQAQDFAFIYVSIGGRTKFMAPTLVGQFGAQKYYAVHYEGPFRYGDNRPTIYYAGNQTSSTTNPFVISFSCSLIGEIRPK